MLYLIHALLVLADGGVIHIVISDRMIITGEIGVIILIIHRFLGRVRKLVNDKIRHEVNIE